MEGYKVNIISCTRDLTAKERIMLKDTTNAVSLDEATASGSVVIPYAYHAILDIHNEKSESQDYRKIVVVDQAGQKYTTGSEAFISALDDIVSEMFEAGEKNFDIEVYRKDSKNYKGKQFITCSII